MDENNSRFAEMQEKLNKPSCFGNYGKPKDGLKCGMCWFWPACKNNKPKKETVKTEKNLFTESKNKRNI